MANDSSHLARQRFAMLQQAAPSSLAAVAVVLAVSIYIESPDLQHILLSVVSGLFVYLAWVAVLRDQLIPAMLLVAIALVCALFGFLYVVDQPLPMRFVQGVGSMGATLLLLVVLHGKLKQA